MLDVALNLDERQLRAAGLEVASLMPEPGAASAQFPGTVVVPPHQLRVVAAPAGGLLEAILVAPFQPVRAGEPLARLRSPDLLDAQRSYLQAHSAERLAREKLRRDEQMAKERIIAERRLLTTRSEHEFAAATLQEREQMLALLGMSAQAIAALREERVMAAVLEVVAPEDGAVLAVSANPGERVAPAAALATVARLAPLWLNLQLPLPAVGAIQPGTPVAVVGTMARGRVLRIGGSVEPTTQSVTVVAEIETNPQQLRPGQVVAVTAMVQVNGMPQWRVPAGTVVRHAGRSWVFVQRGNRVVARPVTVAAEGLQGASIRGAFTPDERVVVRGMLFLLGELALRHEG